jgi:glycosyltransferase involved in cell wall biosynthesis
MEKGSEKVKFKILLIVTQLEAGGAQKAAFNLAEGLKVKGYDVKIVFFYIKKDSYQDEDFEILIKEKPNCRNVISFVIRLIKLVKKERPDIVISFTYYASIFSQLVSYFLKIPFRIASQRNPSTSYPQLARFIDLILGSINVYTSNVVVSKSVLNTFNGYPNSYKEKMVVVYNGAQIPLVPGNVQDLRKLLDLPENGFIITNVGRLSSQKNQQLLIECVKNLDDIILLIIGEGELRNELEFQLKGFEKKVRLVGQVEAVEIPKYLFISDLFVIPSLYEGMSNALLEALSFGLPIISSNLPEQKEVLKEGSTEFGVILPPNDTEKWIKTIAQFRDDESMRLKYSRISLERSRKFSIDSMVSGFEKLWI